MAPSVGHDPIRAYLSAQAAEGRTPGAVWRVERRDGPVSHGAVGLASLEPRRSPASEALAYDLASLTKALATGPLLALLEQEGRIDLEAPVFEILPELKGAACGEASLLEMAAHTAGLPAWRPLYLHGSTPASFLGRVAAEVRAAPRGATLYSDLGYIVAGLAIERATGLALRELFREAIVRPLGLRRTGFAAPCAAFDNAAPTERGNAYEKKLSAPQGRSHSWRTGILQGRVHDGNADALGGAAGHAGLFGTAEEVARLARELLWPEKLPLRARARRRLFSVVRGSRGRTVGMVVASCSVATRGLLPDEAPGHTGFTGTSCWLDPIGERLFVLLTNRVHPVVPDGDFQPVRRGFHRLAVAMTR